jgi:translation initiation factor IF-2
VTDKIDSLRRFKDDVREVQTGFECGIGLVSTTDILEGDVIECFTTQMVSRSALS